VSHNFLALKLYRLKRLAKFINDIYISAISSNLKKKTCQVKPKSTRVASHDTPDANEAWGLKDVEASWIPRRG
jgi:hypothetical protein